MKDIVRIGYIGLGQRGMLMLKHCFLEMDDVEVAALCDWDEKKVEEALALMDEKGKKKAYTTKDYKEILADPQIDAIVIMTGWNTHVELAKASMLAGKYTAVEVGCAYDIQECHELIDIYERTGSPLMMLENCCYSRSEMMALNLAKKGLFGEIVHCRGAYMHYLNEEDLFHPSEMGHYRLKEYMTRNCENYPTHELGPIAKVLGINRGNRMMTLASFASKSRGLRHYAKNHFPEDHMYNQAEYKQGDIVNTIITCANGETILLTLDTTLPRPYYSRDFTVRGTKGMYTEERKVVYFEGEEEGDDVGFNEEEAYKKYDHPLHAEYAQLEAKGGHGGIDWLVSRAFVESVKRGVNTPIDAYDTVTWMSIAALSEMSIQRGGAPVDVPDFTKGKWIRREPVVKGKYCLDEICVDEDTSIF